jgi:hypothetical protein
MAPDKISTYDKVTAWFSPMDLIAIVIALMLPGMPMSVFWPLAALTLYAGWKLAICLSFGYHLLQWLIGGNNVYD